jgi:hypothetical protein
MHGSDEWYCQARDDEKSIAIEFLASLEGEE